MMKITIEKIEYLHPSGGTTRPSGHCHMISMFCQEAAQNRAQFAIPLCVAGLSGIILLPEGLSCPEITKPDECFGTGTGAFRGRFAIGPHEYGEMSSYITLWNQSRRQIRKTAKNLCIETGVPLLLLMANSGEIFKVTDYRSEKMLRNCTKSLLKKQEQEKKTSERKGRLSGLIMSAWRQMDDILANPDIYITELPECKSGTSFGGPIYLPLGVLLECWGSCPEFRLPDGRYVIRFASGLSGHTKGEAISLKTGEITDFESSSLIPNIRAALVNSSVPYRRKAAELIKSGTLPLSKGELDSRLLGDNERKAQRKY